MTSTPTTSTSLRQNCHQGTLRPGHQPRFLRLLEAQIVGQGLCVLSQLLQKHCTLLATPGDDLFFAILQT